MAFQQGIIEGSNPIGVFVVCPLGKAIIESGSDGRQEGMMTDQVLFVPWPEGGPRGKLSKTTVETNAFMLTHLDYLTQKKGYSFLKTEGLTSDWADFLEDRYALYKKHAERQAPKQSAKTRAE